MRDSFHFDRSTRAICSGLSCTVSHVTPPERTAGAPRLAFRVSIHCCCKAPAWAAVNSSGWVRIDDSTPP